MTATPCNFLRIDAMTAESIGDQTSFLRIVNSMPEDSAFNLAIMTFYRLRDLHLSNDPCCWRGAFILVQNWSRADMNSRGMHDPTATSIFSTSLHTSPTTTCSNTRIFATTVLGVSSVQNI